MPEENKEEVENIVPKRGKWVMGEDGKWREGSAQPAQLREDLRKLPSELVTTDIADPVKVHELDSEHVRDQLVNDFVARANGMPTSIDGEAQQSLSEQAEKLQASLAFNQTNINKWRLKAMFNLLNCSEPEPFHGYVWFPRADFDAIELREGPVPMPGKRPAHLKDKDLEVNPFDPPDSLMRFAADHGITLMRREQYKQEALKKISLAEKYVRL
jgi:hypothetical protein